MQRKGKLRGASQAESPQENRIFGEPLHHYAQSTGRDAPKRTAADQQQRQHLSKRNLGRLAVVLLLDRRSRRLAAWHTRRRLHCRTSRLQDAEEGRRDTCNAAEPILSTTGGASQRIRSSGRP